MSQQLVKKKPTGGYDNVMPKSWIEAIKDKNTGQTLVEILQGFNMYFLPYNGNTSSTRCLVPTILRKKGLWITYVKYDGNVYTEWYAANEIDDKSWGDSSNWRIGNNTLVGDITISANGNWVINGTETEFKAIGEKGNTPLIRVANNRLQVSYDLGDTYRDVTDNPVYTKFRWLATTGDTQANNVGRIQASTDEGKTWTNMSNDFVNNLHISRYIGANESLPTSGIAEGTIYAKGPTYDEGDTSNSNPIYRLWVYAWKGNTLAWQDNGEFTSIAAGIVQETGSSENAVMSQKATSEAIHEILYDVSAHNNGAVFESLSALLSSTNLNTLIPTSVRHGGMSIRFIQGSVLNSDNKYVQVRCMSQNFTTDVTQWQGVDDEPTEGSNNLAKSGGTNTMLQYLFKQGLIYENDNFHEVDGAVNVNSNGVIQQGTIHRGIYYFPVNKGDLILFHTKNSNGTTLNSAAIAVTSDEIPTVGSPVLEYRYWSNIDSVDELYLVKNSGTLYYYVYQPSNQESYCYKVTSTVLNKISVLNSSISSLSALIDSEIVLENIHDDWLKYQLFGTSINALINKSISDDGTISERVGYCVSSDYIPVAGGSKIIWVNGRTNETFNTGYIVQYNDNNEVITASSMNAGVRNITLDNSCTKIKAAFILNKDYIGVYDNEGNSLYIPLDKKGVYYGLSDQELAIKEINANVLGNNNAFDDTTVDSNGERNYSQGYIASYDIPVTGGNTVIWKTGRTNESIWGGLFAQFDSNGDLIGSAATMNAEQRTITLNALTVKVRAAFIKGKEHIGLYNENMGPIYIPVTNSIIDKTDETERKLESITESNIAYGVRATDNIFAEKVISLKAGVSYLAVFVPDANIANSAGTSSSSDGYCNFKISDAETLATKWKIEPVVNAEANIPLYLNFTPTEDCNVKVGSYALHLANAFNVNVSIKSNSMGVEDASNIVLYYAFNFAKDIVNIRKWSDLKFLFFSDVHASENNVARIIDLANAWGSTNIDCIINGGDTVQSLGDEGLTWYNNLVDKSHLPILHTAGNHDSWTGSGWNFASGIDIYNLITAKVKQQVPSIVQPDNAATNGLNYYYKDFGNIRIICILSMSTSGSEIYFDSAQNTWLASVLENARTTYHYWKIVSGSPQAYTLQEGDTITETLTCDADLNNHPYNYYQDGQIYAVPMGVIIVNHTPYGADVAERVESKKINSWLDYTKDCFAKNIKFDKMHLSEDAVATVNTYIQAGGSFICWLTGHTHSDNVLVHRTLQGQVMININSSNYSRKEDGVAATSDADPNYDSFDYIGIDQKSAMIKVLRIGYAEDSSLRIRRAWCYDYLHQKLMSEN